MPFQLRKLEEKDAPFMLEWMHDSNITQFLSTDFSSKTPQDVISFIQNSTSGSGNDLHMACADEFDEYLGTVSLKSIDFTNRRAEYAICMRQKAHGTGAAFFATESILRIAFENKKLERVYLYHFSSNIRAGKFYKKVGFHKEGILRHHVFRNGVFEDEIWYSMLSREWETHSDK